MDCKARIVRFWLAVLIVAVLGLWEPAWWFTAVPMFFWLGCPCCTPECTTHKQDDFATDTLSTDYDTRSGTWNVGSGVLTTTSAGALLIANATGDGHGRVAAAGKMSVTAGTFRIVGSYTDDNNYLFGEVTINGASSTLKLWSKVAGADTQVGSTATFTGAINTVYTVVVCWNGTTASAVIGSTAFVSGAYTGTGTQAGMGATPGGTVTFDNFIFTQNSNDVSTCNDCGPVCTKCTVDPPTMRWQVVIPTLANGTCASCADFAGTYILTEVTEVSATRCVWLMPLNVCDASDYVYVIVSAGSPGFLNYEVGLSHDGLGTAWADDSTDCATVSNLSLPRIAFSQPCDSDGTTATITAL